MKRLILVLFLSFILGCSNHPETYLEHINGYWEIAEVTFPNQEKKEYNYNDTIDYIEINDSLNGFRKKLKPNLVGTYEASNDEEVIKAVIENDSLNLYYSTPFSKWKETVFKANENELLVLNANKVLYLYKRYKPLNLE